MVLFQQRRKRFGGCSVNERTWAKERAEKTAGGPYAFGRAYFFNIY
jgi:hypothetical protein